MNNAAASHESEEEIMSKRRNHMDKRRENQIYGVTLAIVAFLFFAWFFLSKILK